SRVNCVQVLRAGGSQGGSAGYYARSGPEDTPAGDSVILICLVHKFPECSSVSQTFTGALQQVERNRESVAAVRAAKPAQQREDSRGSMRFFPIRSFGGCLGKAAQHLRPDASEKLGQQDEIANR